MFVEFQTLQLQEKKRYDFLLQCSLFLVVLELACMFFSIC